MLVLLLEKVGKNKLKKKYRYKCEENKQKKRSLCPVYPIKEQREASERSAKKMHAEDRI